MKMQKTLEALGSHGFTHDVSLPIREVEAAQEAVAILRQFVEAWDDGNASYIRLNRLSASAKAVLAKVGG